jgi:UDP-2,3-diacylglucosamine hydrolase
MDISGGKIIYFASDQHFGAPTEFLSKQRESIFIKWLEQIEKNAACYFFIR